MYYDAMLFIPLISFIQIVQSDDIECKQQLKQYTITVVVVKQSGTNLYTR